MAEQNSFIIQGTLYDKHTRKVKGKKDPDKEYEFRSIKLEVTTQNGDKSYTTLPEFQLANWVGFDELERGDQVTVRFSIKGKQVTKDWHKTELYATNIWTTNTDKKTNDTTFNDIPANEDTFNDIQDETEEDDLPF